MVEENGRTYYHFIVSELNADPYDEVYIDTETGGCEATEQASGEEASVSHDGTTLTIYAEDKKRLMVYVCMRSDYFVDMTAGC